MKKSLLLSLAVLAFLSSFAQGNTLTIFSEDGHPFYLILNGVRQNENPETNVRMDNLGSDYYAAKVIFNDNSIPDIDKKFLMVATEDCKPCDVTYKIKTDKKGAIVMKPFAFSKVFTPPPPNVTVVQYNTTPLPPPVFGVNMQVTETVSSTTTTTNTSDNVSVGMNVDGIGFGIDVNVNDGWGNDGYSNTTTTSTTTVTSNKPTQAVVVEEYGCPPMDAYTFQSLLSSLDNQSFDDGKLTIAKQATSSNCLTAQQVKQVMMAFDWDDSRLDYAKYAYQYCLDQNNYWQVNDAFEWDDNIEELNDAIGR